MVVSKELKGDKDVVLKAVAESSSALQCASEELRGRQGGASCGWGGWGRGQEWAAVGSGGSCPVAAGAVDKLRKVMHARLFSVR